MQVKRTTSSQKRRRMLLLGGAVLVLACVGAAGIYKRFYAGTPGDRKRCAENLQAIGRACISYASSHEGNFPASLKELGQVSEGLRRDQLSCPNAGKKGRRGNYVYVPGYRNTDDPNSILVYEPTGNHKKKPGGHVLLVSGVVNWLDEQQHEAAMVQVKARQARPPAGR